MDFPDPKFIIPDTLPEGLTILAGKPKMGKSWLALGWAVAVAAGTSAMGNITSGLVLIYTRSFNRGDFVQIGSAFGQVVERTLLATRLQTTKNENITIPNSTVLSSHWNCGAARSTSSTASG